MLGVATRADQNNIDNETTKTYEEVRGDGAQRNKKRDVCHLGGRAFVSVSMLGCVATREDQNNSDVETKKPCEEAHGDHSVTMLECVATREYQNNSDIETKNLVKKCMEIKTALTTMLAKNMFLLMVAIVTQNLMNYVISLKKRWRC